jgi:hypothetical protein
MVLKFGELERKGNLMESLSNGSFRLGLATVSQLALHPDFGEDLGTLIRREGGVERAIAALRREFFGEPTIEAPTSYFISVDKSRSLAEMIRAGRYDNEKNALQILIEERFPVVRTGQLQYEKELFLIPPSCDGITTKAWKAELEANGWELEQTPELLALGAKYPDLQRDHYIIAFGSSWRYPGGDVDSPVLWSHDGEREAATFWYYPVGLWASHRRALVSRKRR